jgi:hypothetical protein
MSYNRLFDQPERYSPEYWAELRRKANKNLNDIAAGKFKKEPKTKRRELDGASADEIERGHMVLQRRMYNKLLRRILLRANPSEEQLAAAEEYQAMVDKFDEELASYTRPQLTRFVRLWNKSQKAKA